MTFLLACLISVGGALGGALLGGLFSTIVLGPLALIVFGVCAVPLFFMLIFHILDSLDEKDLEDYRNELRRKEQERKDKLYRPKW